MSFRETEIGFIPSDWEIDTMENALEEIIDYRGKTPLKSEFGIETLSAKSVKNGYIDYSKAYFISEETYKKFMVRGFPKKGDILLTTEAPLGLVARLDREKVGIAQRILTLRGKSDYLLNNYLMYYLMSTEGQHQLNARESGTTVTGIKQKEFRQCLIAIPPFDEQKAIAHILSTLDEKIEVNNQINKTLEKMAQAIFKQWFVDFEFPNEVGEPYQSNGGEMVESELGLVPKGWEVGTLGDILTLNYGKSLPAKKRLEGNVKVYSSAGITGLHNEALIHEPSIIVGRKGTIGTVYFSTEPSFCIDTAYFATQKDSKYPLILMYQLLKEIDLKQYNEDSAVPGLNRNTVYAIKIVIPPVELENRISVQISAVYDLIFENIKQNERLIAIRDLLLPKLMTGEVRIPCK